MRKQENKHALYKAMKDYMDTDRAQHTVSPLSKFGLMQITRQRTKPVIKIDTSEKCPTCNGTGVAQPTILVSDRIENDLERVIKTNPKISPTLKVHPFLYAFFTRGVISPRVKWFRKYYKWVNIVSVDNYNLDEYRFFDKNNDEIRL